MRIAAYLILFFMLSTMSMAPMNHSGAIMTQKAYSRPPTPLLVNATVGDPKTNSAGYYSFSAYEPRIQGVEPLVVPIAQNVVFNDSGPTPYTVTANLPNVNYMLGVLNVSVKEYGGTQYDRPLYVFADGVPIFWGSTQEILNSTAVSDVTFYENLLRGNVTFQVVLINYYDAAVGITGVYSVNLSLYLYPGTPPPGLPTNFVPMWVNRLGYSSLGLNPFQPTYSENVALPQGTYRAAAIIYTEGGGDDEFWYANEPATRSVLLYYNGFLADVVNPFETLYTGGVDLFYWKPMPSINTLAYHNPYVAEITPLLATGLNATISVSVTNLVEAYELTGSPFYSWTLSGVLALWVNASDPLVSGRLVVQKQVYMDSGPIFNPSFSGEVYQEAGRYMIEYVGVLKFTQGSETSRVIQSGRFTAYQTLSSLLEQATLDERFSEYAWDTGMYNASTTFAGNYPLKLVFSVFETPITNPSVIPFEALYAQNGSMTIGFHVYYRSTVSGSTYESSVNESLETEGGFSGILEIINQYGGAVLVSFNTNYAATAKQLDASWIIDGSSYTESFRATAVSPNITDAAGYYKSISIMYSSQ